jgi:hypothetical protein
MPAPNIPTSRLAELELNSASKKRKRTKKDCIAQESTADAKKTPSIRASFNENSICHAFALVFLIHRCVKKGASYDHSERKNFLCLAVLLLERRWYRARLSMIDMGT